MPTRAVVVEDDARYRASLEALLRHAPGFTLAGSFPSAAAALAQVNGEGRQEHAPAWDLAVTDLGLPGVDGIELTRRLKALLPGLKIVVLTVFEDPRTVLEAICAGADGYLLKRTPPSELLEQLALVMTGGAPLTSGVARTLLDLVRTSPRERGGRGDASGRLRLTDREQEVLRLLVRGQSYKEAAAHLGLGLDTVRSHVKSVYRKLQVHGVAEAVSRAIYQRLV